MESVMVWYPMQSSVNNYYSSFNLHSIWDKKWKFSLTFSSNTHVTIIKLTSVATQQYFEICIPLYYEDDIIKMLEFLVDKFCIPLYSEDDIIKMLEFLVDNIFVVFAGKVFQQIVGIPMGTNCAPLLADIFLYSYEAEFIQSLLSTGRKQLASRFNFTYRYIDDVLSINNPEFENYPGPDVSRWTRDQRHDREQHFCILPGFTSVDREGRSTSHFHLWQTWRFQFPYHKFSVPE